MTDSSFNYIQATQDVPKLSQGIYSTEKVKHEVQKVSQHFDFYNEILSIGTIEDKYKYKDETEWNTYFYKKYQTQTRLLYVIIVVCFILILLSLIRSKISYFDDTAYSILCGAVLAMAFVVIYYMLWDLMIRDNINYDEYNFNVYGTGWTGEPSFNPTVDVSNCVVNKSPMLFSQLFSK